MNIESRLAELIGRAGRAAAYGALAQRPGGDRFPALRARLDRRRSTPALRARCSSRSPRKARGPRRDRHAGLHPSADGAAGHLRPSSAGLCRDVRARPRPVRRCAARGSTNARWAPRRWPAPPSRSTGTRRREALGFDRPAANSLDAVSDRDFALETLAAAAIAAMHLSRLAEEIVHVDDAAVRLRAALRQIHDRLLDHAAEAQSRRRRTGARQGRAHRRRLPALLMVMKGLPLAYAKDMQEDKEPTFDALARLKLGACRHDRHGRGSRARRASAMRAAAARWLFDRHRPRRLAGARVWGCRSARPTTSPAASWPRAEAKGLALDKLPLGDHAGDRAAHHRGRSFRCSCGRIRSRAGRSYGGTAPQNVRQNGPRLDKAIGKGSGKRTKTGYRRLETYAVFEGQWCCGL